MQPDYPFAFGIQSMMPPPTDPGIVLQRADEVKTVQRMLGDAQTSTVVINGEYGSGKSTLAALLYRELYSAAQSGMAVPRHFVWLELGSYTTIPDIIAAILENTGVSDPTLPFLKPDQQIALLLYALRRPQENALIVLDQFEDLLDLETLQGLPGRGAVAAFLEMLQADLGTSRILLTCYRSPFVSQSLQESRVRSYLVSRISLPEGVGLLQQRGIQGSPEELSIIWQRCAGHTFALVLFSALSHLSGLSLSYLLNSPDYQPLWSSEVTLHLTALVYQFLNPIQCTLMRTICLFQTPVPLQGIVMSIGGENLQTHLPQIEEEIFFLTQLALLRQGHNEQGIVCYSVHPLLRYYILEHYLEGSDLRSTGELNSALGMTGSIRLQMNNIEARQMALARGHMRVAAYYQQVMQETLPPLKQRKKPKDIEPLLATIRHLCLGWHWQQACDLLFAENVHESMVKWGAWNTLIGLYTGMIPPTGVLTRKDEGLVASYLGLLYGRLGENTWSRFYFEQAISVQRMIGDRQGEAATLANQGEIFRSQNEWQLARTNFEQAQLLNRQQPDELIASALSHNIGLIYHAEGNYKQAMLHYLEALGLAHKLKENYNKGMTLTNIGMLLYEQGAQTEALAVLLSALQLRKAVHDATAGTLEQFLLVLEQKVGAASFAALQQAAQGIQEQVVTRLLTTNMRQ